MGRDDKPQMRTQTATIAAVLTAAAVAGVAAEAALAPAVLLGAAAALLPRLFVEPRRRRSPAAGAAARAPHLPERAKAPVQKLSLGGLQVGRSAVKTVTFRVISSSLDFGWNYILLGELATAAGLSAVALAGAPLFYFLHETAWNHFRGESPQLATTASTSPVSPAMAKTITFRTVATIAEFATNFAVVRDVVLAAELSAFGFVAGPFVYLAHEKAWEQKGPARSGDGAEARKSTGKAAPLLIAPAQG